MENHKDISNNPDLEAFSGIWSKEEAEEIENIISTSCETIHPDDWNYLRKEISNETEYPGK